MLSTPIDLLSTDNIFYFVPDNIISLLKDYLCYEMIITIIFVERRRKNEVFKIIN